MSKKIKIAIISTILLTMLGIVVSKVIAVTDDGIPVQPNKTESIEDKGEKKVESEEKKDNQDEEKSDEKDKVEEKTENEEDVREQVKEEIKETDKEQSVERGDEEAVKEVNIEKNNVTKNVVEEKASEDLENSSMKKSMSSMQMQAMSYSAGIPSFGGSSVQTNTETAVYNGSRNNYLASLEIDGETLNTTFNKENTTYFVQTEGKTELNVSVTKEDSKSKVYITGNTSLKTGENKILISVTAENGNVRYYRLYVTNK